MTGALRFRDIVVVPILSRDVRLADALRPRLRDVGEYSRVLLSAHRFEIS
jgi:hypothetical protein